MQEHEKVEINKKKFEINMLKMKNIAKLERIIIMKVNTEVLHVVYVV